MKKYSISSFYHAAGFWFFFSFCIFITTGLAESFPFRSMDIGDSLPDAKLVEHGSNKPLQLRDLKGKTTVLAFWGADLPAKKKRAVEALSQLQQLSPFLEQRGVRFITVNAQGDQAAIINEVKNEAGLTAPIYLDPDGHAYGTMGIFIMPSFLLVDKDGKIVAGAGSSKQMVAMLQGEVQILLGEKTRKQVEAELHPVNIDKSLEAKAATRHFNMGKSMADKGQLETALREYQEAIANDPKMGEAYVELGCIQVELGKLPEATESLNKGLDIAPGALRGEICLSRIKASQGALDEAIDDLKALIFRNGRDPELRYTLGTFYAQKSNHTEAATEFRKAYELLLKRQHFEQQ